jgi:hypothetical protein
MGQQRTHALQQISLLSVLELSLHDSSQRRPEQFIIDSYDSSGSKGIANENVLPVDEMMRAMLYEAAQAMLLRSAKWSWLKAWAMQIARRRGMKRAIVALARRLAVIMHRIWADGTEFRWTREAAVA